MQWEDYLKLISPKHYLIYDRCQYVKRTNNNKIHNAMITLNINTLLKEELKKQTKPIK